MDALVVRRSHPRNRPASNARRRMRRARRFGLVAPSTVAVRFGFPSCRYGHDGPYRVVAQVVTDTTEHKFAQSSRGVMPITISAASLWRAAASSASAGRPTLSSIS